MLLSPDKNFHLADSGLMCTFISRQVSPIQARSHKMFFMSGSHDPTRHSTKDLTHDSIARRVSSIFKLNLAADWYWSCLPFSRVKPVPWVSFQVICIAKSAL